MPRTHPPSPQNTYTFPRDAFISPTPVKPAPYDMPANKADSFPEK